MEIPSRWTESLAIFELPWATIYIQKRVTITPLSQQSRRRQNPVRSRALFPLRHKESDWCNRNWSRATHRSNRVQMNGGSIRWQSKEKMTHSVKLNLHPKENHFEPKHNKITSRQPHQESFRQKHITSDHIRKAYKEFSAKFLCSICQVSLSKEFHRVRLGGRT